MNKRFRLIDYFVFFLVCLDSTIVYSRNLSSSTMDYSGNAARSQEFYDKWNSQIPCLQGFQNDGSGNCVPASNVSESQPVKKQAATDKKNQVKKNEASEASLIAKNREEIVQRCGISESSTIKIVGMKDENQRPTMSGIYEVWNPHWIVTYRIDTGNVIFGERQFEKKICTIDKKTGAVSFHTE